MILVSSVPSVSSLEYWQMEFNGLQIGLCEFLGYCLWILSYGLFELFFPNYFTAGLCRWLWRHLSIPLCSRRWSSLSHSGCRYIYCGHVVACTSSLHPCQLVFFKRSKRIRNICFVRILAIGREACFLFWLLLACIHAINLFSLLFCTIGSLRAIIPLSRYYADSYSGWVIGWILSIRSCTWCPIFCLRQHLTNL